MTETRAIYFVQLQDLILKLEKENSIDAHPELIPQNATRIKNKFMELDLPLIKSKKKIKFFVLNE